MKNLFNEIGGCCPFCGNKTNVVEGAVYEYSLNEQGIPEYLDAEQYKIACYCKHCQKQLFILPNSNGGYKVYPTDPLFVPYMNAEIKRPRISAIGNMLMVDNKNNPFINKDDFNESCERIETYDSKSIETGTNDELESEDIPF